MAPEPDCLFCGIVAGSVPSEIIADNAHAIAIRDINPVARVHLLVIPRQHVRSLHDLALDGDGDAEVLAGSLALAQSVADHEGVADGYGVATNVGAEGGQSVFHLHFHVVGGSLVEHLGRADSAL
ncbi:MAG TPA: HIT domain-containing protein [Nitriliruptoraceae bacterium]|nr:HIT domain-containing protein [Nitriliruptoraceae bacterium]